MSDFIWVEKYRPQTIEDCILPDSIKKTFKDFLNTGEIPNMLLAGPSSVGKTTVAKALCNELGADFYVINGSDEGRFLDTVRNNAKTLHLLYRCLRRRSTRSSSLMKRITQGTMYSPYLERLLKSSRGIADSSLRATTRIKYSTPYTQGVLWLNSTLRVKRSKK